MTVVVGAGAICLGILAPAVYSYIAQKGAYQAFKRQQSEFTTASTGYPWGRDFARREFGVDVVMNAPSQIWARATLQTVGTSPALMRYGARPDAIWCVRLLPKEYLVEILLEAC